MIASRSVWPRNGLDGRESWPGIKHILQKTFHMSSNTCPWLRKCKLHRLIRSVLLGSTLFFLHLILGTFLVSGYYTYIWGNDWIEENSLHFICMKKMRNVGSGRQQEREGYFLCRYLAHWFLLLRILPALVPSASFFFLFLTLVLWDLHFPFALEIS